MTDILQAARSYYGRADTEYCTTQLFTNQAGQTCIAFEIPLSNEDFAAIVQRMQNMQQPDTQPDTAIIEGPTMEEMRKQYDALGKAGKGKYGSFGSYMAVISSGIISDAISGHMDSVTQTIAAKSKADEYKEVATSFINDTPLSRQVVHVDAPEEPEPVSMDAVWLSPHEASTAQMYHASDNCPERGYLIQWAMLTDEQKQKAKEAKP